MGDNGGRIVSLMGWMFSLSPGIQAGCVFFLRAAFIHTGHVTRCVPEQPNGRCVLSCDVTQLAWLDGDATRDASTVSPPGLREEEGNGIEKRSTVATECGGKTQASHRWKEKGAAEQEGKVPGIGLAPAAKLLNSMESSVPGNSSESV